MIDDDVDSSVAERIDSERRRVPTDLTRNHMSPSARSIPPGKELKNDHWVGECGVTVKDLKHVDFS
jgi:hypothetical protein